MTQSFIICEECTDTIAAFEAKSLSSYYTCCLDCYDDIQAYAPIDTIVVNDGPAQVNYEVIQEQHQQGLIDDDEREQLLKFIPKLVIEERQD